MKRLFVRYGAAGMAMGVAAACGGGDEGRFHVREDAGAGAIGGEGGTGGAGAAGGMGATGGTGATGAVGATGGMGAVGAVGGQAGAGAAPPIIDAGAPDVVVDAAPACLDDDFDGVTTCDGDCDDNDPLNFPGNLELCGDGADNDCNGKPDEASVCSGVGTFVSVKTGRDTNPGTQDLPVRTIQQGIDNALIIQANTGMPVDVFVAEGTYKEHVRLVEGISLLGGFECSAPEPPPPPPPPAPTDAGADGGGPEAGSPVVDAGPAPLCEWGRDISSFDSIIENQDFNGVTVDDSVTRMTRMDGFVIKGLSGDGASNQISIPGASSSAIVPGSIALQLNGGSPVITNNRVIAGDVTGGTNWPPKASQSVGIAVYPPSNDISGPLIDSNTITAGSAAVQSSIGISLDNVQNGPVGVVFATISRNTIRSGSAPTSNGIAAWASGGGTLVRNNDIFAGDSTGGGGSWGIVGDSQLDIDSNRINADPTALPSCGTTTNWCGGIWSESMTATITNNVIHGAEHGRSTAVQLSEFERPRGAIILNGNTLFGAGPNASVSAALVLASGPAILSNTVARMGRVRNNILNAGEGASSYSVYENDITYNSSNPGPKQHHPLAFTHNDLFVPQAGAATGTHLPYRRWDGTTGIDVPDITAVNALGTLFGVPVSDNIDADCALDATWHLGTGSPCIDVGTSTEAPSVDFERDDRPQGSAFDIGADESTP